MHRRLVANALADVGKAVAWADAIVAAAGFSLALRNDLQVCVEEALANLIQHGRAFGDKEINLAIGVHGASAVVQVSDRCAPFDVVSAPLRAGDDARPGGAGLKLIRAFAHQLRYVSKADRNILTMTLQEAAAPNSCDPLVLAQLRLIPAFAKASETALVEILAASRPLCFVVGEKLMTQGESSEFALLLLDGQVSIGSESRHGLAPVAQIQAPALIGEIGALARLARTASVEAATPVRALRIERGALLEACRHAPEMLVSVIAQLGQQIKNVNAALGLYASGFAALERGDLDDALAHDLSSPSPELKNFTAAFDRLAKRVSLERRARSEMASAALIQRQMLPSGVRDLSLRAGCDLFGDTRPAKQIGGDLFDILWLDDDRLALCIGDVCGKGVPASLFMCVTVTVLRLAARERLAVPDMMQKANALLCTQNQTSMFATLFYGVLDVRTKRFEYVNCGHNRPFLLGARDHGAQLAAGGAPLGIVPGNRWPSHTIALASGQGIFMFTDGVTEANDPAGAEYGEDRLVQTLRNGDGRDAKGLVESVIADVELFSGAAEQFDDITCLAAIIR